MKRIILAVTLVSLAALLNPVHAADQQKLTVDQIASVTTGLSQLDTYDKTVKDGARETIVKQSYNFGGGLRWLIAGNLDKGRRIIKQYQDARTALVNSVAKDGKVPDDKIQALNLEDRKMQDAVSDVQFDRIKAEELKLNENPIPASVLSLILPIVDQ